MCVASWAGVERGYSLRKLFVLSDGRLFFQKAVIVSLFLRYYPLPAVIVLGRDGYGECRVEVSWAGEAL